MASEAHALEVAPSPARMLGLAALAAALLALLVLTIAPLSHATQSTLPSVAATNAQAIPLAARSLVSGTLGKDQASYAIHRSASGLVATNRSQGLFTRFGARGVQVRSGSDTIAVRLRSLGYGQALKPVAAARPSEHANRVSFRRGPLTEWYANGPLGLEQAFTLMSRPVGARTGRLTLALSLSGSLTPSLERDARSLRFAGSSLRYTGLTAFDARGHGLRARLELRGQTLLIRVNDAGARYPLTIDPFIQQAKLLASDGAELANFGESVAISGDTIAVGAPGASNYQGAVYVFVKPADGWASGTQTAKLTASQAQVNDRLGSAIAISGDTIVAGAFGASNYQGAVYAFVKPADGWASGTQTAKLTASDDAGGHFGESVAISGDTIVASAAQAYPGAAYVFVRPVGGWANATETARLTASDGDPQANLGHSVAISGDTIAAGAPGPTASNEQGAVYVFVKPTDGWASGTEAAKLTAPQAPWYGLGLSVAISGETIVAGAPFDNPYFMGGRACLRLRRAAERLGERDANGDADRLGREQPAPRPLARHLRRHHHRQRHLHLHQARGWLDERDANRQAGAAAGHWRHEQSRHRRRHDRRRRRIRDRLRQLPAGCRVRVPAGTATSATTRERHVRRGDHHLGAALQRHRRYDGSDHRRG